MLSAMLLPNRMEESLTTVCSALMASLPRLDGAAAPQLRPETLLMQKLAEATTNVRAAEQRSRAELARALAAQLAKAVRRYVAGGDEGDDQRALEVRILSAEDALRTVIRPEIASGFPDVAGVMQAGGPDAVAKMQAELGKWVGSQDSKGLLNAPPWDVPVGGLPEAKSSP
jgi:hypothetical protein